MKTAGDPVTPSVGPGIHEDVAVHARQVNEAADAALRGRVFSVDMFAGLKRKTVAAPTPPEAPVRMALVCGHKLRLSAKGKDARDKRLRDGDADFLYCTPTCAINDAVSLRQMLAEKR